MNMTQEIQYICNAIVDYFRKQDISEDHVLDFSLFEKTMMQSWDAEQIKLLEPALVTLISEGFLVKQNNYIILTTKGFIRIYMESGYFTDQTSSSH